MARGLTKKEKGFIKDVIKTGNGTQAALANYDTTDYMTAANIASENLNKPKIQKALADRLPDDLLNQVHLEGLYASKPHWEMDSESKTYENVGDEPDYAVRHKYLDSAYKLKGSYAPEKSQAVNVNLNAHGSEELLKLAEKVREQLRKDYESPRAAS